MQKGLYKNGEFREDNHTQIIQICLTLSLCPHYLIAVCRTLLQLNWLLHFLTTMTNAQTYLINCEKVLQDFLWAIKDALYGVHKSWFFLQIGPLLQWQRLQQLCRAVGRGRERPVQDDQHCFRHAHLHLPLFETNKRTVPHMLPTLIPARRNKGSNVVEGVKISENQAHLIMRNQNI